MDILAHGLWSGAIYQKKRVWWAVFFGIAPDLFSFGIFFVYRVFSEGFSSLVFRTGPPAPETIPAYVYQLYNGTHSLVVWAFIFAVAWVYFRRIPWEFTAWAVHILIDIPTHTTKFFPTPFLWPLPQPFFVNGISWATPWFLGLNYTVLFLVYAVIYKLRKSQT